MPSEHGPVPIPERVWEPKTRAPVEVPPPRVPGRLATINEVSRGAQMFEEFLHLKGFITRIVYAEGHRVTATKVSEEQMPNVSVRGYRPHRDGRQERVVGLWFCIDGKWKSEGAWHWFEGVRFPRNIGITKVKEILNAVPSR